MKTSPEDLERFGLPADFDTLSEAEQYLWFETLLGDEEKRIQAKQAEVDQLHAIMEYIGPIWQAMPKGTTLLEAIAEAKRVNPDDFVTEDTVRLPDGRLLTLR